MPDMAVLVDYYKSLSSLNASDINAGLMPMLRLAELDDSWARAA